LEPRTRGKGIDFEDAKKYMQAWGIAKSAAEIFIKAVIIQLLSPIPIESLLVK